MEGHDLFTQAETDTRASGFGCEKRNEDFIQSFRDDARSVVLDVDGDLSGVGLGGDADQGSPDNDRRCDLTGHAPGFRSDPPA